MQESTQNPYEPPQSNTVATPNTRVVQKRTIEEALAAGYDFDIQEVITKAWSLVDGFKLPIFLGLLILLGINIIGGVLMAILPEKIAPVINVVFTMILSAIGAGLAVLTLKRLRGETINFSQDFFSISSIYTIIFMAAALTFLLTLVGFVLLIIPGIYLATAYYLTQWIIIDNPGVTAWQAMEASRKLITQHWFKFFGLILVLGIIALISAIPLLVGLIWTIPLMFLSIGLVYQTIFEK